MVDIRQQLLLSATMLLQHRVEKTSIRARTYQWQQSSNRFANIAAQTQVQLRPPSQAFSPHVNLSDGGLGRQEVLVGKIRAEKQQRIAGVHRLVGGAPA